MPRNSSCVPSGLFLRGSKLHQVRDGGDALLLQKGGLAHQRACCQKENPALRLYERAGFQILAERDTEYLMLRDIAKYIDMEAAP